ncbi:MAG: efflux RND transporter periplasmic adaptor subunit [Leptospiraceae bacterium]|nr:efflux RND transporter periplasmic adaptor subunit [Leptospiraceae bacterium]
MTAEARRGSIIEAVYGIGTVRPEQSYTVKLGISATIERLYVREGDKVTAGALLVRFQDIPAFRSPFEGVITEVLFSEGETAFPQTPVLTVTSVDRRYLEVVLEQEGALRVRPGQKCRFGLESLRGTRLSGQVKSIYPSRDQFLVRIQPDALPPEILPGMTADVIIEVSRKDDALLIPLAGVHSGQVTIVRNGRRQKVPVEIGSVDGEWAEVLTGEIESGDPIVLPATGD